MPRRTLSVGLQALHARLIDEVQNILLVPVEPSGRHTGDPSALALLESLLRSRHHLAPAIVLHQRVCSEPQRRQIPSTERGMGKRRQMLRVQADMPMPLLAAN